MHDTNFFDKNYPEALFLTLLISIAEFFPFN